MTTTERLSELEEQLAAESDALAARISRLERALGQLIGYLDTLEDGPVAWGARAAQEVLDQTPKP